MSFLTPSRTRALGILLALISAGAGVALFASINPAISGGGRQLALPLLLLVAAMILFAWATPPPVSRAVSRPRKQENGFHRWAYALALAAYVLALILTLAVGENGLVRWLWVCGMILLVTAHIGWDDIPRLGQTDGRDMLILVGITAVAFVLRFWRLPDLPSQIHTDIAAQGLQALEVLGDPGRSWFDVGWSNIPMFDFVMMAGSMKLFGADLFGLSMTAVIQGTLTILALYLLGREMFGRWVGLLAAALLAISIPHIHFSRIVTTASPLLFITLTFFFLFRGLRLRRGLWFALSGISLGLGLLVYYPSRVAVIIVAALFLWLLLRISVRRTSGRWPAISSQADDSRPPPGGSRHWITFGFGALLGFGPMLTFVLRDFDALIGRGKLVTLWNPTVMAHLLQKYGADSSAQVWLEQLKRTFLTFFLYPDASTHFGFPAPMISVLTATLFVLGLGYSLRWLRDERYFTLVIWVLATLLLGGVSTNDPPFWPHLVIVLPAVMLLAAVGAERAWMAVTQRLPAEQNRQVGVVLAGLLALAIVITAVGNWQAYVKHVGDNATVDVRVARYVSTLPSDRFVRLVMDPLNWHQAEIAFMSRHGRGDNITAEHIQSGALQSLLSPTIFILTPNHGDLLPALQSQFPGGASTEHRSEAGQLAFYSYEVEPEQAAMASEPANPARPLKTRILIVWIVAALAFLLALALGFLILLRRPAIKTRATEEVDQASSLPHDRLRRMLLGMSGALALAYLAQRFYDNAIAAPPPGDTSGTGWMIAGTILYLAAMILFALFAPALKQSRVAHQRRPRPTHPAPTDSFAPDARIMRPSERAHPTAPSRIRNPAASQAALLILALIPYALSMLRFYSQGEDTTVRWLWLVGLTIFLGGQVIRPTLQRVAGTNAEWSPRFRWWQVAILLSILAGGFWLRFNHLADIPQDLHGDMASMGIQARDWIAGRQPNLFREGWANIPLLGFLPAALSLNFFGNDLFALNFSAVVAGMFTLLGLYLLTWRLFDSHRLAALATAILAINIPHIHFSRLAAYMDPWPFMLFAMFFLVDGMKARRPQAFALAGVLLGFGVQMYYSGRVVVVVLALSLLYLLVVRPRWLKENILGLILLLLGTLIALGPSLLHFATHWDALVERSRAVFLFYEPVMTHLHLKYGLDSDAAVVLEQIKRSLLIFNHSVDSSSQFGFKHPMFGSLLAPLLPLGFAFALRRWRTPGLGLSLIWLITLTTFGSVLTNNAPFWPRLVGVLPVAALLAALTLDRFGEALVQFTPRSRRRAATIMLGLATIALLFAIGQSNWSLYRQTVAHNARPQALIGRYLAALPDDIAACGFGNPNALRVRETAFLAWPRPLLDLPTDAPDGLLDRCPGPPFVWILSPDDTHRLAELQARWPAGRIQEHLLANSHLAFISYLVTDASSPTSSATPPPAAADPDPLDDLVHATAYLADGSPFIPRHIFRGDVSGVPTEIEIGQVEITNGDFTLRVAPLPDHDAVYDYVKLVATDGTTYQFEAEDAAITSGDTFAPREGVDNHWWLQTYEPFSGAHGLVAQKQEIVPVLSTTVELPNGVYTLFVGSFTGDPKNGVFGLGIDYW